MIKALKIAILQKFDTQADFSMSINEHESKISQVVRGRRKLTEAEAAKWLKALECDPAILEPVTKSG